MNRSTKKVVLIGFDLAAILSSSVIAYIFLDPYVELSTQALAVTIGIGMMGYIALATYFKLYSKINRYTSIKESITIFSCVTSAFIFSAMISLISVESLSIRFIILTYAFSVASITGSRITWRIYHEHHYRKVNGKSFETKIRTLVVGAGDGGSIFIRSLRKTVSEVQVIGFIDDDSSKQKMLLHDVSVLGTVEDIPDLVQHYQIEQITIAIPSLGPKEYERILDICNQVDVTVNQMPSVEDVLQGKLAVSQFREIDVVDLLGRDEVKLNMQQIAKKLSGKVILVSGAGGSIGSEICRQIARFSPAKLILVGHGENSIYLIDRELKQICDESVEIIPVIADVQDRQRIFNVMEQYKPDRVYHAAAHKHVPLMEFNPKEAVKNNIFGTKNMAEAAKAAGVGSFVMISTDKAVNPPNVMGATKRVAEMIVTGLNEKGKTRFAAVRFGNVLGSRGSVVPLFKEQIKQGGPLTVTDYRMTRYFMTIPEASKLVIQAGALAEGGEIFILDMGEPVKIYDLAKKVVKLSGYTESEIPIIETGIRPGEKLYEELLVDNEATDQKVYDKIFVGKVNQVPLAAVMQFVHSLDECQGSRLKEKLIAFANERMATEPKFALHFPPHHSKAEETINDLPQAVQTQN